MISLRAMLFSMVAAVLPAAGFAQEAPPASLPAAENSPTMLGGVAAVVNDEIISIADVAQRARMLLITIGAPANEETLKQALPRALEELIDERLQLQKASEYDVKISEEELDGALGNMAAQNGASPADFYASLQSSGINPDTVKEQMRAEMAWQRIMNGLYGSRIRISRLQIDGMLNRLAASAGQERYQLSEIFLYAPSEEDKQNALQAANVIVEQIAQGARFQLAAQQYSNAPTAAVGGDLGWVSLAELDEEASSIILQTQPPALTQPIIVDDGIYIYAVRAVQKGSSLQYDYDLRQLLASDETSAELNALSLETTDCSDLESTASDTGLTYIELGLVPESDLTDAVRSAVSNVSIGGATSVINTPAGPALIYVCDKQQTGARLPSRDQLENRLFSQQLSLLSQRDLRDLKREATIIRR